jgi:transposase
MQLKTILNRVERHKSFVYQEARWVEHATCLAIEVSVEPRANGRPICSGCGKRGSGYDRLQPRRFEFVPLWQIRVFLVYALRRVDCACCGVKVERVPWVHGKEQLTIRYRWFLAGWAKRLSWQATAEAFQTTWEHVRDAVRHAVWWGLMHRDLSGVRAIGIDEICWRKGHHYLTLVYQIDASCKRLLWVCEERTEQGLRRFFNVFGGQVLPTLEFVCSDMWQPYLNVIAAQARQAIHVLDRFHIMKKLGEAIDEVRAAEARRLKQDGYEPVLKHSRWCLLKRPENRTEKQTVKLAELLQYNLKSVRAHLHREDFQRFWEYQSPAWAGRFLDEWTRRVMRSQLEPMKRVARSLRKHHALLLNWFRAQGTISAGTVEGFNNKAKLAMRKSYGFKAYDTIKLALYHQLGNLPEPDFTHKFC